ncbi:hypothetical protein [Deinococcus budaensis]|uniref:DNA-binding transcriptional ArsR family regulator n=1 Tax=Deinococcus budaensis TaxID=1665626 RepID=A0A7W8LPL7_9DEIO|nr:hypothetical protein [Deinococcus budaensis]MBB5233901.1 DNA-binding transcriptional ArsR family regulator [Deinococcus budaensis]
MDRPVLINGVLHHLDPQRAPRLIDGWEMRYLGPFLGREATLSAAARQLGVSLSRLHYQVGRLQEEGLLEVTRLERRGRRELKVYRAVADVVFVPFELLPLETVEVALARADAPWLTFFLRSLARVWREHPGQWGMRVEGTGDGGVRASIVAHPERAVDLADAGMPAVHLGGWVTDLRLDFQEAKALQHELGEVLARYVGRRGAERYLLQVRLAPLLEDPGRVPNVTVR